MLISKNSASQYPGYAAAQRAVSLTSFAHDHHALKIDCMPQPAKPKIYHIVHVDRLPSIVACQGLLCDAEVLRRCAPGTTIGMSSIKQRRWTFTVNAEDGHLDPKQAKLRLLDDTGKTVHQQDVNINYVLTGATLPGTVNLPAAACVSATRYELETDAPFGKQQGTLPAAAQRTCGS